MKRTKPLPERDERLEVLIARIPGERVQAAIAWLRRPSSRWARLIAGVLLVFGGLLSILPVLGIWMLPLGIVLLSEDIPPLRWLTERVLDWIERHRPHWLRPKDQSKTDALADQRRPVILQKNV